MGHRPEAGGSLSRKEGFGHAVGVYRLARPLGRNSVCSSPPKRKRKESPMAELDTKDREKLDKRKFAYVDKEGEGHLPINDESHVRNAMARFNQTKFESGTKKETARKKIVTAAKRRGIKVAKSDDVAKRRKTKAKR
jgi:hypothetical protein